MQTINQNRFAVAEYDGTLIDRRRRALRPPQGSRLVEEGDQIKSEPLEDPGLDAEYFAWTRAIIVAVQPLAGSWWAVFETGSDGGSFLLREDVCKRLGLVEAGTCALEHELFVKDVLTGHPQQMTPVPGDDEQLTHAAPHGTTAIGVVNVQPTDACPCRSGLEYGRCHGAQRATFAQSIPAPLG